MLDIEVVAQPAQAEDRPPVEGFSGWWDASDIGSMQTTPQGRVSQWRDKSGNARHLAQGGGPTYQGFTGSVSVNGRNVYLQRAGVTALMQGPTPVTNGVFSVCFVASVWATGQRNPWIMGTTGGDGRVLQNADGTIATYQGSGFSTGRQWELRRPRVIVGRLNGATGHQVDVDGRHAHSGAGGSAAPHATLWDVGARELSETWIGWLGEIVVYTRLLTTSETERMSAYLTRKWGLA